MSNSKSRLPQLSPFIIGLALLGLATSCSTIGNGNKAFGANGKGPNSDPPVPVGVVQVKNEDLSQDLVLTAEFRPYQEVDVHAKVSGYVREMRVDVGDRVTQGQLLAVLEIPEYVGDVERATAAAKRSEEEVNSARSELQRAAAAREETNLAYTRLQSVNKVKPNLIAQQEIDEAAARDRVAEAQVSAARASLAAAQLHVAESKAEEGKTKVVEAYSQIIAPFTGVITKRYADTGALIQAGTASNTQAMPLVRISQNAHLRLVLPVPESIVPQIHVGDQVEVKVQSLNRTIPGRISRFARDVDTSTRTMETEVDVANPDLSLTPGMYASVTLKLEHRDNVLTVPVQAVARQENKATVLVVNGDHTLEERTVTLGLETPTKIEVTSGLKEGEMVVIGNRSQFKAGQKVEPRPIELEGMEGAT